MAVAARVNILKWVIPGAIVAIGVAYLGLAYVVPIVLGENVEVIAECHSPDGSVVAVFYTIGGGGAAGYLDEFVSVYAATDSLRPRDSVFGMNHGYEACLHWLEPSHLQIIYPEGVTVHWSKEAITLEPSGVVQLSYATAPADDGVFVEPKCQPCS